MEFVIKIQKLECGSYMATVAGDKIGTPGGVVYADSAGEAYEIYKGRLEAKGHTVIENKN